MAEKTEKIYTTTKFDIKYKVINYSLDDYLILSGELNNMFKL